MQIIVFVFIYIAFFGNMVGIYVRSSHPAIALSSF